MTQPKVRFRHDGGMEFPDWSKDKWLNLGQFVSSGTLSKADLSEEGTPCILYGELYTKYGEIAHTIYSKTNSNSHIFSKKDDVILPKSGETPEDISTATCIPYDDVSLGGDLIVFRHNEKVIGTFLSYLISNRAKNAIASMAQGKSVVHISEKGLANIELSFPCIEEQKKIADFLSTVDEVIAQSVVELQNLKQQKKAAMQKIFSQEVRFRHENGTEYPEWEEKCFDDIFSSFPNKSFQVQTKEYFDNGKYPIIDQAQADIAGYSDDENKVCQNVPCIVFGDHTTILKYVDAPFIVGADGVKTLKSDSNYNSKYAYYLLSYNNVQPTGYNRHFSKLKEVNMSTSFDHEEQQKIADFLSDYDDAISYAKQELDKWKELKKGLVQQMFV